MFFKVFFLAIVVFFFTTVLISLTTFFVLFVIFIFGGEVIRGFMFALMVGVLVGTYSSLFIASPIMLDTIKREKS